MAALRPLGLFLAAVFALMAQAPPRGIQVWAVDDGVRVNPVTGKLIEGRPDIHRDYPARDPRAGNLVWDAQSKTVRLKAAKNEFVAFQVMIEAQDGAKGVDVKLPALNGPGGYRIAGRNIGRFKDWYTQVRQPSTGYEATSLGAAWYPDALLPYRHIELNAGFPFSIPDLYNNIPAQKNHAVWIDVFVPKTAPAGAYTGTLEVSAHGARENLSVALEVWDFALPEETNLRGDIWNDSMKQMPRREEMQYYQLAHQHRFLPLVYAYRPKLSVKGAAVTLDWTEYDARVAPYLDGSAFTERHGYWGPGAGIPVDHMMLPFDIEKKGNRETAWPMALPAGGRTPEYEAVWRETAKQIRAHMDADPRWRRVRKIAFLNGLDESYNEAAYEKMLYYGRLLHEALGRGWFSYRIDGGYTPQAIDKLRAEVELWVCHTVSWDPALVEKLREQGLESWFYGPMIYEQRKNSGCGSNTFLDLDLLVNRGIGWVGWKYQSGWVEWEFDWNAYAAWYEAENFKDAERSFNGSGQLIYRGVVMGYDEPIPSIRLKAQRRGLQDYEYFRLLAERTGSRAAADRLVNGIIYKRPFGEKAMLDTEIWKNDPAEWERVRYAAGDEIVKRK